LVEPAVLFLAKTVADLKNSITSSGEEPFHAQLGRGMEETVFAGEGDEVGFRNEDRQTQGSVDLYIVAFEEKPANGLQQL
jgi:hypothetical protein